MAKEITASCHAGFKKNIHKLIGRDKMRAVKTESCRGEKFFLFNMILSTRHEVRSTKLEVRSTKSEV